MYVYWQNYCKVVLYYVIVVALTWKQSSGNRQRCTLSMVMNRTNSVWKYGARTCFTTQCAQCAFCVQQSFSVHWMSSFGVKPGSSPSWIQLPVLQRFTEVFDAGWPRQTQVICSWWRPVEQTGVQAPRPTFCNNRLAGWKWLSLLLQCSRWLCAYRTSNVCDHCWGSICWASL